MRDVAQWIRPGITGVEALHARFLRHRYGRHLHEAVTIALVDEGAAAFEYRGVTHYAGPGSVFVIDAEAVHTGRPATQGGLRYRVLYVDRARVATASGLADRSIGRLRFHRTVARDPALAASLCALHDALALRATRLEQEERLLTAVGDTAARCAVETGEADRRPGGHRAVTVACEYLRAHVGEDVSLEELSLVADLSPSRLIHLFTAAVGMPPHCFHLQLKVLEARRLLSAGTPPAEVAARVGFFDQAHFTRAFKQHTGVTPGRFAAATRRSAV